MKNCPGCSSQIAVDAAFCSECGVTLVPAFATGDQPTAPRPLFTSFILPLLQQIDKGTWLIRPVQWLFVALAVILLIAPLGTIYELKQEEVFTDAFGFALLISIFCLFTGWIGFQIWWNRRQKINEIVAPEDDFKAIPIFSSLLQTLGEWYGTYIAIMGAGVTLSAIFLSKSSQLSLGIKLKRFYITLPPYINYSNRVEGLIASLVAGFMVIIVFRYLAELIRAIAAIAKNTNRIK